MNRQERRKLKKQGKTVKTEPVLLMKPSEIGRAATQGVGRKAMMHEINQQILARDKEYQLDIDTMVLWTLQQCYGWGAARLKKFYVAMMKEHLRMREFYEMDDLYPERYKMKEKGVDVEAWYEELFDDEGNFKENQEAADARSTAFDEEAYQPDGKSASGKITIGGDHGKE